MKETRELMQFLNEEIPIEIGACVDGVFDLDADPEVSWSLFRELITKLKKRHKKLYVKYMESDAE